MKGEVKTGTFLDRLEEAFREKESVLCIGLDPALPEQRSRFVIPSKYLRERDDSEARLEFCLDIIEKVADFCVAAKPNEQYLHGFTSQQHRKLTDSIRDHGLISIYDCKLGDVRDTAESAIFYYHKWGYDGITFNPFPGNMEEIVEIAHGYSPQIGVLVLTLMSNPEAEKFMKNAKIGHEPVYLKIAEDVKRYNADGCVVGATNHVKEYNLKAVRERVGEDKILLIPGIGVQGGDPEKVIKNGGRNLLINVGRDIIYSEKPEMKAKEYCRIFNDLREKYKGNS